MLNSLPTKLLAIILIVGCAGTAARGCSAPLANTAAQWSPQQQANAERIAAQTALDVAEKERWQRIVLPQLQDEEAAVAADAIRQQHERRMQFETATHTLAIVAVVSIAIAISIAAIAFCAALTLALVRNARRTVQLLPVAPFPAGGREPLQFPGFVFDPRTGYRPALEAGPPNAEHANSLCEWRKVPLEGIANAVLAVSRNGRAVAVRNGKRDDRSLAFHL